MNFKFTQEYQATLDYPDALLYDGIELRGNLDFSPKQEGYLALSYSFMETAMSLKWWGARAESGHISERVYALELHDLQRGVWYRFAAQLTATENVNEWDFLVRVRERSIVGEKGKIIWTHTGHIVGLKSVWMAFCGDEQNLKRDERGGVWLYCAPKLWLMDESDD
jgi:GH43 family beta-xylosidase